MAQAQVAGLHEALRRVREWGCLVGDGEKGWILLGLWAQQCCQRQCLAGASSSALSTAQLSGSVEG